MLKRFEVNKLYRYISPFPSPGWDSAGYMANVLTGQPVKCLAVDREYCADFKITRQEPGRIEKWNWQYGIENWVEVETDLFS